MDNVTAIRNAVVENRSRRSVAKALRVGAEDHRPLRRRWRNGRTAEDIAAAVANDRGGAERARRAAREDEEGQEATADGEAGLLDLTLLAPDLQVRILELEAVDGREPVSERDLRGIAHAGSWPQQRAAWSDTIAIAGNRS
jgi:hypothetical protein